MSVWPARTQIVLKCAPGTSNVASRIRLNSNCQLRYLDFMSSIDHLRLLARYNRVANERLYEKCAELSDAAYRAPRRGSFGSIHALLNHILLGDRIWMSRFRGEGQTTPWLATILYD